MNNLTMSHEMETRNGMISGTGTLFRCKVSGFPGGEEAFVKNVRSGTPNKPLWRVEGKESWQRLKHYFPESEAVLDFTNGKTLTIDMSDYQPVARD
jgi:hypothetical protein